MLVFSCAAGTKQNRKEPCAKTGVLSSVYLGPGASYYLRNGKIGWCRLMLRLEKGNLTSGDKRTPNRSELVTVLCGFVTKQESTSLPLKHLAMGKDTTFPLGQEYQTNLLWIILGICSKDRSSLLLSPGQEGVWDGSSEERQHFHSS